MGRDRDSPANGLPEAFNDPGRSLTPHSARRIVTSGASEIVVDDFINAYLKERPKTIPEMAMYQPPEPEPPPREPPPRPGRVYERPTKRGIGPPAGEQPAAPDPDREPVTTPRGAAPLQAQASPAPSSTVDEQTTRLLADRDRRISQLENELTRMKGELEQSKRASDADEPATRIAQPAASNPSNDPRSAFRPAAPPRPGPTPKLAPMVRTVPMVAAPTPAPAPRNDATMMLPSVETAQSSPPPARNDATMMLPSVHDAANAHPSNAHPPSAHPPNAHPPSAHPPNVQPSKPPGFAGTIIMTTPVEPTPAPPPAPRVFDEVASPSTQGASSLTPAPFFTPIENASPPQLSPFVSSPEPEPEAALVPRKGGGKGKWVALALIAGIAGVGSFAYLRGIGPMADLRARLGSPPANPTAHASPSVAPTAEAKPSSTAAAASKPTADAATSTTPSAAAPVASAAPSASSAGPTAPSASAAPVSAQPAPDATQATPEELKALLSFQAYLTVRSSADAGVVAQGQDVGRTNQRLVVRCGPRNVRLRGGDGRWMGDGVPVKIACMQHTIVTIEPGH